QESSARARAAGWRRVVLERRGRRPHRSLAGAPEPVSHPRRQAARNEHVISVADILELLRQDLVQPFNAFSQAALWPGMLNCELSRPQLAAFAGLWWPLTAGTARYAATAKVANLDMPDGRAIFREVLAGQEHDDQDQEKLFRRFAGSLAAPIAAERMLPGA